MSPPVWFLSLPLGFINTLYPRFVAALLAARIVTLDNVNPRDQLQGSELAMKDTDGYVRRALGAHNNGWESMILWTSAVLSARVVGVSSTTLNATAAVWLASRILYNPTYILGKTQGLSFARTGFFAVSLGCCFALFIAGGGKL